MSTLRDRLSALTPEKRALLERQLTRHRPAGPGPDEVVRRERTGPAALSFPQQRLWFADQLSPGEPTYNAVLAMRLHGPLDVQRLEAALRLVISRHEVLRTVVAEIEDEPRQVVLADPEFSVEVVDLRELPEDDRGSQARQLIRDAGRRPYDLARDLMLRVLVVRTAEQEQYIAFFEHHIAFDSWSDEVLFTELRDAYAAGAQAVLPELPLQYADFAEWQRERVTGPWLAAQSDFWRDHLLGAPALLKLPWDRARPAVATFSGSHTPLQLSAETAEGIRRLATEAGATVYMVAVASVAALLHRWAGVDDVVLGTPAANRNQVEVEPLIGFFSNTLPLRIKLDGSRSFTELVRGVRAAALAAFDHQELPFEKIVEAVAPVRDPAYNPLFQVNVRAQAGGVRALGLPGVTEEPVEIDLGYSRFDLAFDLRVESDGVAGYCEYNELLFKPATVSWLVGAYGQVLEGALADPAKALWDLPWPSATRSIRGSRRRG